VQVISAGPDTLLVFVGSLADHFSNKEKPTGILNDTIETCRIISFRDRNRNEPERSRFAELQTGVRSFGNYISGNFRIYEAVTASGKVANLCAKLLMDDFNPIEKYNGQDISKLEMANPQWNGLNRLKRFPDQSAFFYWYKCIETLQQLDYKV